MVFYGHQRETPKNENESEEMKMFTSLDLLVIAFMGLAALTLLSLSLMFLLKNQKGKRICFYVVAALGLYVSSIAFRIGLSGQFPTQIVLGVLTALVSVGAFVVERTAKGHEKRFLLARVLAAAALVAGFMNAIL